MLRLLALAGCLKTDGSSRWGSGFLVTAGRTKTLASVEIWYGGEMTKQSSPISFTLSWLSHHLPGDIPGWQEVQGMKCAAHSPPRRFKSFGRDWQKLCLILRWFSSICLPAHGRHIHKYRGVSHGNDEMLGHTSPQLHLFEGRTKERTANKMNHLI